MKFPLHLLLASATPPASAYLATSPTRLNQNRRPPQRPSTQLQYKEPSKGAGAGESSDQTNVWSVLANTERWISDTLDRSNKAANARLDAEQKRREQEEAEGKNAFHFAEEKRGEPLPRKDNPYARKEVSYVCEMGDDVAGVVGGVFRRVREARELGEGHGKGVEARAGDSTQPTTMRQTNVVVIPNCDEIEQFAIFDRLIQAINQARRASRDFVLKKKENDDGSAEWVVSINCAHLHPGYGTPSPEEQLAAMKHEEEEGEVDVNIEEYKRRRDEARRSPYPSVIVEVQSTPPPDFGQRRDEEAMEAAVKDMEEVDKDVTSEDVAKLEALFGMSAASKSKTSVDDPFYDALGEAFGKKQVVVSQTPLQRAQNWVLEHDPAFNEKTSTFTKSNSRHVDAAYEYVFNNLAMLAASTPKPSQKSYVVLPNFLPTSATSFDRFAGQVSNIIRTLPSLAEKVIVSTFHPEHVLPSTRSPVPIVVITWK